MQPRRKFIKTLAGLAAASTARSFAEPGPNLRPPEKPKGFPTMWVGAVTATGGVVKTKIPPGLNPRLLVREAGGEPLIFKPEPLLNPSQTVAIFRLEHLRPLTDYQCTLEVKGAPASFPPAMVRTFPPEGQPANFAFAFGSCARTGSQHEVFNTIARKRPAVLLHLGDFHYCNISRNDPRSFRAAWDTTLSSTTQGALYRNVPLAYIYDDHDFGPNDADKRSPARPASRTIYREYSPHYPLPAGGGDAAIYQAFTVGRVRFILTDLRSERDTEKTPDSPAKSMMGAAQKEWFKRELLDASRTHGLVVWGSSVPWIGAKGSDSWQGYANERRELSNFIAEHRIKNLCIICGDAHMLAADNGKNSDYSDSKKLRIPVLHGSAFDQGGSLKGGPYSEGTYLPKGKDGLFGWVEVEDDGQRVAVSFTGRNHLDEVKVSLNFEVT